jgi:hypothetical protein
MAKKASPKSSNAIDEFIGARQAKRTSLRTWAFHSSKCKNMKEA